MYPSTELLDTKKAEGVIELQRLPSETTIYLESNTQVYELTLREDKLVWAVGVGKRGFSRQVAEFIGSIDQKGTLFSGLIVKDHHMILKLAQRRYTTGCIRKASIKGKGYSYELWEG